MLRKYDLTIPRIIFLAVIFAFFALFFIYPLIHVLRGSIYVEGEFTLIFFRLLFSDPARWQIVLNSINLGLIVTILTTLIAVPMAYAMVRHEFPGKGLLSGLILAPMVLPPFVGAVGMRQMFARFGSINLLLMNIGLISEPIDWLGGGMLGVVIMETLHLYPIMYLNVAAALANVDPSLEEAGRNVGANGLKLFRRITFPLMLPGYFAGSVIVFIWAFTDLGTPLVFEYTQVVPVQIFNMLSEARENPMGYALVVLMIMMTVVFFYLSRWVVGEKRYEMIARGHVASASRRASNWLSLAIWGAVGGVAFVAFIPHISVILTSLTERWFMTVLPTAYTTKYYGMVFTDGMTMTSIRNSLFLSGLSTGVDLALGITIAYLLARTRMPGRGLLDTVAMLPLAVPGLIIAFGFLGAFSGTPLDAAANPIPLLVIAYAVRRLPYMVRAAYAGFMQTSITLEEAARNVGAGPLKTLWKITMPLVFANLIAGGILCFSFAMMEVSDSLILAREERFYPITKAIYSLLGRPDGAYIASALGVLGMALLIVSLLLAGKFLGKRLGQLFRV